MQTSAIEGSSYPTHILCGIDLEGRAIHAVQVAVWLSEKLAVPMELVHAFPPAPILWGKEADMPEWTAGTEATGRSLRESLRAMLAAAPSELDLRTSAETLRFHIKPGHPAQVIVARAREARADLIVLGPHEKRAWIDFGSTARGVLAHASGVWMQPATPRTPRRILVAIDLSEESRRALEVARGLAQAFEARITAVQVFAPPVLGASPAMPETYDDGYVVEELRRTEQARFESMIAAFEWRGVPHDARFEHGTPTETLLALQDEHDLIVMGTHGRTGLSATLLGSVAHSVLKAAHVPVLALRRRSEAYLL